MYTQFFGLRCLPFEDRADAQFFYAAAAHEETLAAMEYEAHYGTGIGIVLGEAGTGKTLLIRALLSRLHATDHVVVISSPANGSTEIIRECCKGFGVSLPSSPSDARRLNRLRRHLSRTISAGHRAILIVDQAEHLTPANMGEIETLMDLHVDQGRLLRVILAGHPRLRSILDRPEFVRIRQQAFQERVLSPFTSVETNEYIRHRLRIAGAGDVDLFDAGAIGLMRASSGGVPRLINQLCNAAMIAAYGAGESCITASVVAEVAGINVNPSGVATRDADGAAEPQVATSNEEAPDSASCDSRVSEAKLVREPIVGPEETGIRSRRTYPETSSAPAHIRAAELRLLSLIERAERAGDVLSRNVPQAADSAAYAQRRVERILNDADERMRAMEARLTEVMSRSGEAFARVQRVERASKRAEDVEARIAEFAAQMADRVDEVQVRVAHLLGHVEPLEEARKRAEETIDRAKVVYGETTRLTEESLARGRRDQETAERSVREFIAAETETFRQKMSQEIAELEKSAHTVVAAGESELKLFGKQTSSTADVESAALKQRLTDAAAEAEAGVLATFARLERETRSNSEAREQLSRKSLDELRKAMQEMAAEFEKRAESSVQAAQTALAKNTCEARNQAAACHETAMQLATASAAATDALEKLEHSRTGATGATESLLSGVSAARECAKRIQGATEAGLPLVERLVAATSEAEQAQEKACKAVSTAESTIARASDATERLAGLQIDTNMLAARLDSDMTVARQLSESLTGLIASADQKTDQLSSIHAAASHLHERLTRTAVSGHQLVERADETVNRLEGALKEADARSQQLAEETTAMIQKSAEEAVIRFENSLHEADVRTKQLAEETTARIQKSAEESTQRAEQSMSKHDVRAAELGDRVATLIRECAGQIERLERDQIAVADVSQRTEEASDNGSRIAMELALLVEQGGRSSSSLKDRIEESNGVVEKLNSILETLQNADELNTSLERTVENGRSLQEALSMLVDQSARQRSFLDEANASMRDLTGKNNTIEQGARETVERLENRLASLEQAEESLKSLIESHERIEREAKEAVNRLGGHLSSLKYATNSGEQILGDYFSRIETVEEQLTRLQKHSEGLERGIAEQTTDAKAIVEDAQAQAEHLEQVCAAVRKVFAGLSQASLQANDQSEGLRRASVEAKRQLHEFTTDTQQAGKALHEWLQEALRVQTRLEQIIRTSPSIAQTHPMEPLRSAIRKLGSVERSASVNVEDEPGAARAREVKTGIDKRVTGEGASRAEEIARLIAEAKSAVPVGT